MEFFQRYLSNNMHNNALRLITLTKKKSSCVDCSFLPQTVVIFIHMIKNRITAKI